jgi:hypothetical protein
MARNVASICGDGTTFALAGAAACACTSATGRLGRGWGGRGDGCQAWFFVDVGLLGETLARQLARVRSGVGLFATVLTVGVGLAIPVLDALSAATGPASSAGARFAMPVPTVGVKVGNGRAARVCATAGMPAAGDCGSTGRGRAVRVCTATGVAAAGHCGSISHGTAGGVPAASWALPSAFASGARRVMEGGRQTGGRS